MFYQCGVLKYAWSSPTLVETFLSTSKGCVTNISGTLFVRQPTEESKQLWKTLNWVCKCCVCFDILRAEDTVIKAEDKLQMSITSKKKWSIRKDNTHKQV